MAENEISDIGSVFVTLTVAMVNGPNPVVTLLQMLPADVFPVVNRFPSLIQSDELNLSKNLTPKKT